MESRARDVGASLIAIGIGAILVVSLWLMPDLTPADAIPVVGQEVERARIIEPLDPDPTGLPRFVVELEDGERLEAVVQDGSAALPGCRRETHTESATRSS